MSGTSGGGLSSAGRTFAAADLQRELESLNSLLLQPLSGPLLHHWIADIDARQFILADTVWGVIQWRKSLGRPSLPTLSPAFSILHTYLTPTLVIEGGVGHWIDLVTPTPEPSKFDGPEDADWYRVSFVAHAVAGRDHEISVGFAPHLGWEHGNAGSLAFQYAHLQPATHGFKKGDGPVTLDPFEVVQGSSFGG